MPRDDHRRTNAQEGDLLAELQRVYSDADATFAGWSCEASTECCRFGVTGREPYVTSIELVAVRRAIAALGGPRAWKRAQNADASPPLPPASRRALPLAASGRTSQDERPCPMLTAEGRCAIYAARPLGCRTFYCDRASQGATVRHKEINALVRRVQDLGARHAPDGDRGRPLTNALADLDPARGGRARKRPGAP